MTWPEIAFGLGLSSPQAARQRYERLASRTDTGTEAEAAVGTSEEESGELAGGE